MTTERDRPRTRLEKAGMAICQAIYAGEGCACSSGKNLKPICASMFTAAMHASAEMYDLEQRVELLNEHAKTKR